jgi:hypothetical protein
MGYIRSDEDWYIANGMSQSEAAKQVRRDELSRDIDYGVCNPRKAKQAAEDEAKIERQLDEEGY